MKRTLTLITVLTGSLLLAATFEATRHAGALTGAATGAMGVSLGCSGGAWEPGSTAVDVAPETRALIRATARQSMVIVGEPIELELQLQDRRGRSMLGHGELLQLSLAPQSTARLDFEPDVALAPGGGRAVVTVVAGEPGTVWFEVRHPDGELTPAFSNPVWIRDHDDATTRSLAATSRFPFWGDLHVHSNISGDATSPLGPGESYAAVIDDTQLHFAAITDHDGSHDDASWRETRQAANAYNCTYPADGSTCYGGRHFVTLLGYEWTSPSPYSVTCAEPDECHGHRNVYMVQDDLGDVQYRQNGTDQIPMLSHEDTSFDAPCELWATYDDLGAHVPGLDFMTIPHHVAAHRDRPARADWEVCPQACGLDAGIERLVEIYSRHGSGEFGLASYPADDPISCRNDATNPQSVREALKGSGACEHRLGFIGSSDAHDGWPGQSPDPDHAVETCPRPPDGESLGTWQYLPYRAARSGLVCALVAGGDRESALTRHGVFEALQDRAVYATTGVRINAWLEFEMGGEHYIMGEELSVVVGEDLTAIVHADMAQEELDTVELLWLDPATDAWQVCAEWSQPGATLLDSVDVSAQCLSSSGTNVYYLKVRERPFVEDTAYVTEDNRWIDVSTEDGEEGVVELTPGLYTQDDLADEVREALEEAFGAAAGFAVGYDDTVHRFTIEATGTAFDLLWHSGDHNATSAATLLGFDDATDSTGETSYESDYSNLTDGWTARHMAWTSPIWVDVE